MKNVNITHPGGDGNPGRRAKSGNRRSEHVVTHLRRRLRQERAWARGAELPKGQLS